MGTSAQDVIIVGGGFIGNSIAYHLARRDVDVLVLEAGGFASGTSGACAGRAQVSESHSGTHLDLVLAGLTQLETLEKELDCDFEWRRLGNLILIEREDQWEWWTDQVAHLTARGVPAEMLDLESIHEAEPLLRPERFLGAAWCLEGHLNPFKYCQAFAQAARRHGAVLRQNAAVIGFEQKGDRLTEILIAGERFSAATVLVAAGAWTGKVLRQAGLSLPVRFTHAEAMISEPLPPVLRNHVGLADFYATIHSQAKAVSVGVAQQITGTLLITEAVEMTETIHRANGAWGMPGMAHDLLGLFPSLGEARIVRSWAAPSPFLPDEQPAIGWMPGLDNLFVATCFQLTVTTVPVISKLIAGMVMGERVEPSLEEFSPARFGTDSNQSSPSQLTNQPINHYAHP
jgi:sarcosine oxidase subunit beta